MKTDALFKFIVFVDDEIRRIKPRPKKYKITILWKRFINDETWSTLLLLQETHFFSGYKRINKFTTQNWSFFCFLNHDHVTQNL